MADKKISELPEHIGVVLGTDLLPLVGGSPYTNYRLPVKSLLGNVQIDLPQTVNSAAFGLSANVVPNSTATLAAAQFTLTSGNTTNVASNTFGVLINHTFLTGAGKRAVAPRAFIGILDLPGSGGAATTYLMDIGALGNTVSANVSSANTGVVLTVPTGARAATHLLKISVNGADYWLLAANTVTGV